MPDFIKHAVVISVKYLLTYKTAVAPVFLHSYDRIDVS